MLYPRNIEEKIGFDKIRELLMAKCLSPLGQEYVEKMQFSADRDNIEKWIRQSMELSMAIESGEPIPTNNYFDARPYLKKARVAGAFLTEEEFHKLKLSYATIVDSVKFLNQRKAVYPFLSGLTENIAVNKRLIEAIGKIIDDSGVIKDNASPELIRIRSAIQQKQTQLRKSLNTALRRSIEQGLAPEDATLTVRNGRMVIPIGAAYKRSIKGFIHDESSTGQTVYIEPEEALENNNAIRNLQHEEKREIVKLLISLTDLIRPEIDDIFRAYQLLGILDFVMAKAKLAIDLGCEIPEFVNRPHIDWIDARHPLLFLSHRRLGKAVVPLNVTLHEDQKILIVSGPNAGGKSVCLKTIALLQYMFQCGIAPPAREGSAFGLFQRLFIDIGDEQSIENDLSTYSSHLKNMKHFVNFSNQETLFLIDEFGAGTDPQIGGAIAEAVLEQLYKNKSFGVVTTHYSNLKKFADSQPGIVNGAMRFDIEALEPLYELQVGKPGSSFAIEIARKIGLPRQVLNGAKERIGVEQIKLETLLAQLENDKKNYEEKLNAVKIEERRLAQVVEEYEGLRKLVENNKKTIIEEARREAQQILQNTNQVVEKTIRQIKENKAEKEATKKAREDLEKYKASIKPAKPKRSSIAYQVESGEIGVKDWVRIKGQNAVGQVVQLHDKSAEIAIGNLKSTVKINRLEKISRKEAEKSTGKTSPAPVRGLDMRAKIADFSPNLDLRGARAEEALGKIDAFIDDALLLGQKELRIIHGKGNGVLRQVVREQLRKYPIIKDARDEHIERGGAGVTLVKLN